jgi:hypothetical protein
MCGLVLCALWLECGPVEKGGGAASPIPAESHVAVGMAVASKEAI